MNKNKSNWIKFFQKITYICIFVYIIVLICYLCIFNGGLSKETNDWSLFVMIFNGLITTVLTSVNIYCIIQINVAIENNNDERHIQNNLFEAQKILAELRFEKYNSISEVITNIKASLYKKEIPLDSIEILNKMLMSMDYSFLFKSQELKHKTISQTLGHDIVVQLDSIIKKVAGHGTVEDKVVNELQRTLSHLLALLEFHIIAQLVRGNSIQRYITENKGHVDCTLSCIKEFADEICTKMDKEDNKSNETL